MCLCCDIAPEVDLKSLKKEFLNACHDSFVAPPKFNYHAWEKGLQNCPNSAFKGYILSGIAHGFRIGFEPKNNAELPQVVKNHPLSAIEKAALLNDITAELKKGHMLAIPNKPECLSPLGVVPKDITAHRVIRDYSFPKNNALNDYIPDRFATTKYVTHTQIAQKICSEGAGCYIGKVDLKSAFRQLPVNSADLLKLGHKIYGQYVIDTRFPYGIRSACQVCQAMGTAVIFITDTKYLKPDLQNSIACFVDDYLCIKRYFLDCKIIFLTLLHVCNLLGIEVNQKKCVPPATTQILLGLRYDTINMQVSLPEDKVHRYTQILMTALLHNYIKRDDLISLIGKLTFSCVVIFPGSAFLQNMRSIYYNCDETVITLNDEMRADFIWWIEFLKHMNGIPIHYIAYPPQPTIDVASDACGYGYGAICDGKAFGLAFTYNHICTMQDIALKELYAATVAVATWGPNWSGKCVRLYLDSTHAKGALIKKKDSDPLKMKLVRFICMYAVTFRFRFFIEWIPTHINQLADKLSRLEFENFENLCVNNNIRFMYVNPLFDHFWQY